MAKMKSLHLGMVTLGYLWRQSCIKDSWICGSEVQRRGWGQIHKSGISSCKWSCGADDLAWERVYRMRSQGAGDAEVMCVEFLV